MSRALQGLDYSTVTDRLGLADLVPVSDLLLQHRAFRFRVAGWSMYPTLCKGDQLTVEPVSPVQLHAGDLLLFRIRSPQGHGLVCHRLVEVVQTGPVSRLITRGDAVSGGGEAIQPDQILGRVVAVRARWPLASGRRWVGGMVMELDRARERLTNLLVRGLESVQKLHAYRVIMRNLLSRRVVFYLGVPEGSLGCRYQRLSARGDDCAVPTGQGDFRLTAKLAGRCVGSLRVTASADGPWIDHLYVRILYRRLGVASRLLALAAAATRGAGALRVSLDPANTAALHLATKLGFRPRGAVLERRV